MEADVVSEAVAAAIRWEEPLRQAAHGLAGDMLAGKVGTVYRRAGWMRICSGSMMTITAIVVAVTQHSYAVIAVVLVGAPQLVMGWLFQKGIRRRVEQAHRLNMYFPGDGKSVSLE